MKGKMKTTFLRVLFPVASTGASNRAADWDGKAIDVCVRFQVRENASRTSSLRNSTRKHSTVTEMEIKLK
jgi:hypothetical protein